MRISGSLLFQIISVVIIFNMFSCTSEIENYTSTNDDNSYFPLKLGASWTYEVDSIIYDQKGTLIDTVNIIMVETITDTFKDGAGQLNYLISRDFFNSGKLVNSIYVSAYKTDKVAVKTENNISFIKMEFPANVNTYWEGNALFDSENTIVYVAGEPIPMFKEWTYSYKDVSKNVTLGSKEYLNCSTIIQTDTDNSIEKRYSEEIYSKNIGLIYKKMVILNTQKIEQSNVPWEKKAEEGFILEVKLLNYSI